MTGYALGSVLRAGVCDGQPQRMLRGVAALCLGADCDGCRGATGVAGRDAQYVRVVMTRPYWFLFQWQWYEQFGLIAPLIILETVALKRLNDVEATKIALARMAVTSGMVAGSSSLWCLPGRVSSHAVAASAAASDYFSWCM